MKKLTITINGDSVDYNTLPPETTQLIDLLNDVTDEHTGLEKRASILQAAKLEISRQIVSSYEQYKAVGSNNVNN